MKTIVLTSGGLDSTTLLAIAKANDYETHCLSFDYNQRNSSELVAIKKIVNCFDFISSHKVLKVDLAQIGGSSLTDSSIKVQEALNYTEIPSTYVPARNTIFLSLALAYAETIEANRIMIGVNALDYSNYPDCRPEYIKAFNAMANLATANTDLGNKVIIDTPLIALKKSEIIGLGAKYNVDYSLTVSCYNANSAGEACGNCDSCYLRKKGFAEAGIADPTKYEING